MKLKFLLHELIEIPSGIGLYVEAWRVMRSYKDARNNKDTRYWSKIPISPAAYKARCKKL